MIPIPNKYTISIVALLLTFLFTGITLFDVNVLGVGYIYPVLFLFTVPGYLLLQMGNLLNGSRLENGLHIVAVSAGFLMLFGYAHNEIWHAAGIARPLEEIPLLISFWIVMLLITALLIIVRDDIPQLSLPFPQLRPQTLLLPGIAALILVTSVLGTFQLNNDFETITTLVAMTIFAIFLFFFNPLNVRPAGAIMVAFVLSLGVLFMYSLRSWNLYGSDIVAEATVALKTMRLGHWTENIIPNNLYSRCLSITILPTMLTHWTNIPINMLYKAVYPIIIALGPVAIIALVRRFASTSTGFYSAVFFLSNPGYWGIFSTHVRAGMSVLFFILLINQLLVTNKKSPRYVLILFFGIGMIVSHYSTAFIALGLFSAAYGLNVLFLLARRLAKQYKKLPAFQRHDAPFSLNLRVLIALYIFFFVWYADGRFIQNVFTQQLITSVQSVGKRISSHLQADRGTVTEVLDVTHKTESEGTLTSYYEQLRTNNKIPNRAPYPEYTYEDYVFRFVPPYIKPPNIPPQLVQRVIYAGELYKRIGLVLMAVGFLYLTWRFFRKKVHTLFYFLSIISLGMVYLSIVMPYISVGYNIGRVYIQSLVMLSFVAILGLTFYLKTKPVWYYIVSSSYISIHFLVFTGALYGLIGGSQPQIQFSNQGLDYKTFYLHKEEIAAVEWIPYMKEGTRLYTDQQSINKIKVTRDDLTVFYIPLMIPEKIAQDEYIFLTMTGNNLGIGFTWLGATIIGYQLPVTFIDENKNLIYSNGGATIYQ
ncbi:MAG: DUF2206 domain-containing protein [Patescibacteria group bacterium]